MPQQQQQSQQQQAGMDLSDSFSRRSSLSSHGSDFSDFSDYSDYSGQGGAYLSNVSSLVGHQQPPKPKGFNAEDDDYSYTSDANDSLDLRHNRDLRHKAQKVPVTTTQGRHAQPRAEYLDDDDSLGDDDTYAADSLDLRQYRKQKHANNHDHDCRDVDLDEDSMGDDDTSVGSVTT